jgi:hypothetical protein
MRSDSWRVAFEQSVDIAASAFQTMVGIDEHEVVSRIDYGP